MRDVDGFTEEVVSDFDSRKSSTLASDRGELRSGCMGRGTWLFLRCSGVAGGEEVGEDGASVGDDVLDCGGNGIGSKSRSGMGGESKGRLVTLSKTVRRSTLNGRVRHVKFASNSCFGTDLITSNSMIPRHRFFVETFRRRHISTTSSVKRINSRALAAHLY